ncbi:MAG: TVP38/TMEM64 family protein [Pseudomonadota bacterium]
MTITNENGSAVTTPLPSDSDKSLLRRIVPVALVAAGLIAFFALGLDKYFSLDALRDNRDALRAWVDASPLLALALFTLVYASAVAISFPGASILTVFGGFLFGLWPGVPAIVIAATLGGTVIFLASKTALSDVLSKRAGGFVAKMEKGFHEHELNYMLLLRLMPVFPFWAVNIGAGVVGVSLRNFFIGTLVGIIPGSFVYASIGNAADTAFDAGENVTLAGILFKPETLLPIIGLAVLSLLPIILKRFNKDAAHLDKSDA